MKFIFTLTAIVLAVDCISVHEQWSSFKEIHEKNYKNIVEEKYRFEVFQNNLKLIEEHNEKYEKGESSYYMKTNKFADMTAEEFTAVFSSQPQTRSQITLKDLPEGFTDVPDSFDWREKGAVSPVRDQGYCASGYAFSTMGALEALLVIHHNTTIALSEQEILDCSYEFGNNGCLGGFQTATYNYVSTYGIRSDSDYPYQAAESGECNVKTNESIIKVYGSGRTAMADEALMSITANICPTAVLIYGNPLLQHYEGGIYDDAERCSNDGNMANHGVLVVGYGSEAGKDYWIIKNSWGDKWGEEGFFRLQRNPSICGILNFIVFPYL